MLSSRIAEKGVDVQTERKVEQWRKEVMAEMHHIQAEINLHRQSRVSEDYGSLASSMAREINDV